MANYFDWRVPTPLEKAAAWFLANEGIERRALPVASWTPETTVEASPRLLC